MCNFPALSKPGLPALPGAPGLPSLAVQVAIPLPDLLGIGAGSLPAVRKPSLPALPGLPGASLAFSLTVPAPPGFPFSLPPVAKPGLPALPAAPGLPSLSFPVALPAPPCPLL